QLTTPTVIDQQFILTEQSLYRNNFAKSLTTSLEGAITLPVVNIRLGVAYHLVTNYIYYDSTGFARQTSTAQNIVQLSAVKDLRLGSFNINNRLLLQTVDDAFIRLPNLVGEHSFFFGGKWFGVLNVNLGVDVRYFNGFKPYYYNSLTRQFQLQDRQTTEFFLQVDPFFSMRVTRFRFFIKYNQLNSAWDREKFLYLTADNPYPDGAIRFGVSWRLVD
ncbi:MAG: putative porin, partial [Bacteroidota bacterium]